MKEPTDWLVSALLVVCIVVIINLSFTISNYKDVIGLHEDELKTRGKRK